MSAPSLIVASDESAYRDMMVDVLTEGGFTQVQCIVGRHAFAPIRQQHPDLVLLDINSTPSDTGWTTLQQMRCASATRAIPVLICTTDPRLVREKGEMLRAHGCEILAKPFDLDVLLDTISTMLDLSDR